MVSIINRSRLTFTQRFTTSTGLRHAAAAHSHTIAMAEDWEQEDWEAEDFKPVLPAKAGAAAEAEEEFETAGQAVLAKVNQPDMSKFADEDAEDEPAKVDYSIKPQPKKKVEKKYDKGEEYDEPLADPVAEKLRQQRMIEEADLRAAQELFGGASGSGGSKLDSMLPKSVKDFEEYAEALVSRYVLVHKDSKNYKVLIKALLRGACEPLSTEDVKEVENSAGTIRADKVKAEKAAAAAKSKTKKTLNVGKASKSAGLDEIVYNDLGVDDDYDFM